ncbi:MAG: LuxR C-terminal-related transcriptional regulator [Chloroflexota bacterium]
MHDMVTVLPRPGVLETPLPPQATSCLGREGDAKAIRRRLLDDEVRLLTLTGPAGVGKTRLAIHVAGELTADFAAVHWVDLTAIAETGAFLPDLARQVAATSAGDGSALPAIRRALQSRRVLLVLDNFEHVAAAAHDVGQLLALLPELTVLVTSRSALRLPWEQLFLVAPLALPCPNAVAPMDTPSVSLFLQRVQALRPEFRLTPDNTAAVIEIPGQAKAFNFFGEMARLAGDYDRATEFYEQSLALYQQAEDSGALAVIRHNLGYVAQHRQDYARATVLFSDALALYRHYGDRRLLVICLAALAAVASIGRSERAARLFAAAEAHLETMGTRMQPADLAEHQRNVADVRTAMEEQAFQRAWAEGRTMSLEQALAYVQEAAPGAPPVGQDRSPRPAPAPAEQLTARELEVADLIARGLTNRQIALRLVIAERTVDKHVGNILAKFGFASRAQIAAWAATERLGR